MGIIILAFTRLYHQIIYVPKNDKKYKQRAYSTWD